MKNELRILCIRQPWAELIVAGVKRIENRTWSTQYRGPVLIHAARRPAEMPVEAIERAFCGPKARHRASRRNSGVSSTFPLG